MFWLTVTFLLLMFKPVTVLGGQELLVPEGFVATDSLRITIPEQNEETLAVTPTATCSGSVTFPATPQASVDPEPGPNGVPSLESHEMRGIQRGSYTITPGDPGHVTVIMVDRTAMFRQFGEFNKPYLLHMIMNIPQDEDGGPASSAITHSELGNDDQIAAFRAPVPLATLDADIYVFVYRQDDFVSVPTVTLSHFFDGAHCKPEASDADLRCLFDQALFAVENRLTLSFYGRITVRSDAYAIYQNPFYIDFEDAGLTVCALLEDFQQDEGEAGAVIQTAEIVFPRDDITLMLRFVSPEITVDICEDSYIIRSTCLPVISADPGPYAAYANTVSADIFRTQPEVVIEGPGGNPWTDSTYCILLGLEDNNALAADRRPFIRWLICDIPGNRLEEGRVIVPYAYTEVVSTAFTLNRFRLFRRLDDIRRSSYDISRYTNPSCGFPNRCMFDIDLFTAENNMNEDYNLDITVAPGIWALSESFTNDRISQSSACEMILNIQDAPGSVENGYRETCFALGGPCEEKPRSGSRVYPATSWGQQYAKKLKQRMDMCRKL